MQHVGGRRHEADRDLSPRDGREPPGDDQVLLARRRARDGDDDAGTGRGASLTTGELDALFERPARPRVRMGVGAGIVLALVALAVGLIVAALQPSPLSVAGDGAPTTDAGDALPGAAFTPAQTDTDAAATGAGAPAQETVLVHVVGAVVDPGVVTLTAGARVVDAINAAGGFTDTADRSAVNLARAIVDGEQVYVPEIGETPPDAPPGANGGAGAADAGPAGAAGAGSGLINLNTAGQAELETLPRIGPALALRIIEYREQNGGFGSVDELKSVSGIGDATFEALAPLVTV